MKLKLTMISVRTNGRTRTKFMWIWCDDSGKPQVNLDYSREFRIPAGELFMPGG